MSLEKYLNVEEMWHLFKYFDANNVGFITASDIQEVVAREGLKMSGKEAQALLREVSRNAAGRLTFEQFRKIFIKSEVDDQDLQLFLDDMFEN